MLSHLQTSSEEYSVVFTAGATAGLKLVGESFPWAGADLRLLEDSHTSLAGLRTLAEKR